MRAVAFIDWISYTAPNTGAGMPPRTPFSDASVMVAQEFLRLIGSSDPAQDKYMPVKPNSPFGRAVQHEATGARFEWGGGSDRVLVSFPGKACHALTLNGRIKEVLSKHAGDVSRIDISMDMVTDLRPPQFTKERSSERFKTGAHMVSEEGETVYVGSWSSDRFCRVYRYNAPHPRADYLRAEHVFRGKQAKALASQLVKVDPVSLMGSVGEIYGWKHAVWVEAMEGIERKVDVVWHKDERKVSKTVKWLEEQCAPALVRMVKEGEISSIEEWLKDNVYGKLSSTVDDGELAPSNLGD